MQDRIGGSEDVPGCRMQEPAADGDAALMQRLSDLLAPPGAPAPAPAAAGAPVHAPPTAAPTRAQQQDSAAQPMDTEDAAQAAPPAAAAAAPAPAPQSLASPPAPPMSYRCRCPRTEGRPSTKPSFTYEHNEK